MPDDPFCGNNVITMSNGRHDVFFWSRKSRTSLVNIDWKKKNTQKLNYNSLSMKSVFFLILNGSWILLEWLLTHSLAVDGSFPYVPFFKAFSSYSNISQYLNFKTDNDSTTFHLFPTPILYSLYLYVVCLILWLYRLVCCQYVRFWTWHLYLDFVSC